MSEGELIARLTAKPAKRKWPLVFSVKRADTNSWHADISFARCPTDAELQALEISLRDDHRPAPALSTTGEPKP